MSFKQFQGKLREQIVSLYKEKDRILDIIGDQRFLTPEVYEEKYGYKGIRRYIWRFRIWKGSVRFNLLLYSSLLFKRCYFGSFNGEFGNFLSYVLPFLCYLHKKGVKVHYCGLELYKPFMIDDRGGSIIETGEYIPDFYHEVEPDSNISNKLPQLQQKAIKSFNRKAKKSWLPFWNINDDFFYWFVYKNWIVKKNLMETYALNNYYGTKKENSVVIFPRKKKGSPNVGEGWDYLEIINSIKGFFDKVYVLGHPALSLDIKAFDNVEVLITNNNKLLLEKCSNSKLIINQHSGTKYLGAYTNSKVLVIYKGDLPMVGIYFNLVYNYYLRASSKIDFAFSNEEIIEYCKNIKEIVK